MSVSWANIAAWLQDCTAKENGVQKMGRIFYIMGKSATGKDTVFKEGGVFFYFVRKTGTV